MGDISRTLPTNKFGTLTHIRTGIIIPGIAINFSSSNQVYITILREAFEEHECRLCPNFFFLTPPGEPEYYGSLGNLKVLGPILQGEFIVEISKLRIFQQIGAGRV